MESRQMQLALSYLSNAEEVLNYTELLRSNTYRIRTTLIKSRIYNSMAKSPQGEQSIDEIADLYKKSEEFALQSIDVVEKTRLELLRPQDRISFLAASRKAYVNYVDMLMENDLVKKAWEYAERTHARVLQEEIHLSQTDLQNDDRSLPSPYMTCLLYTSPSPRDRIASRMPSSA